MMRTTDACLGARRGYRRETAAACSFKPQAAKPTEMPLIDLSSLVETNTRERLPVFAGDAHRYGLQRNDDAPAVETPSA